MKKLFAIFVVLALILPTSAIAADLGQNTISISAVGPHGAAPNSGDGIPDGSGMDGQFGPYGN